MNEINEFINNTASSYIEKLALGRTLLTLSVILNGREDALPDNLREWLDGKRSISGSVNEANYRNFVVAVRNAIKTNPNVATHPYLAPAQQVAFIEKRSSRIDEFANDSTSPLTFNMQKYIDTICKKDGNRVVGLNTNITSGTWNDLTAQKIGGAFERFSNRLRNYSITKD